MFDLPSLELGFSKFSNSLCHGYKVYKPVIDPPLVWLLVDIFHKLMLCGVASPEQDDTIGGAAGVNGEEGSVGSQDAVRILEGLEAGPGARWDDFVAPRIPVSMEVALRLK